WRSCGEPRVLSDQSNLGGHQRVVIAEGFVEWDAALGQRRPEKLPVVGVGPALDDQSPPVVPGAEADRVLVPATDAAAEQVVGLHRGAVRVMLEAARDAAQAAEALHGVDPCRLGAGGFSGGTAAAHQAASRSAVMQSRTTGGHTALPSMCMA